jgi:hypothetical protein
MPRRSLAEQLYEKTVDLAEEPETHWLVLYDFHETKPNSRFWANIKRLTAHDPGSALVQYSALKTMSRRVATATKRLVEHYGGAAMFFRILDTEP